MHKQLSAVALCVAALGAAYYFAYYLPRVRDAEVAQQHRKTEIELAQRCNADGIKFFDEFSRSTNDPSMHYLWDDPEFHYSAKLNTCLVHIRYIRADPGDSRISLHYNRVVDVYGNRAVIFGQFLRTVGKDNGEELMSTGQADVPNYTSVQYFAEKKKLFGE